MAGAERKIQTMRTTLTACVSGFILIIGGLFAAALYIYFEITE